MLKLKINYSSAKRLRRKNIPFYRICKAHCEETKSSAERFARYREILNCEINVEFFRQNKDWFHLFEYHKNKFIKNENREKNDFQTHCDENI